MLKKRGRAVEKETVADFLDGMMEKYQQQVKIL